MTELEYGSKIASMDDENCLKIRGNIRVVTIPLGQAKPPSNGLFLGEQLVGAHLKIIA